ncbi:MAG: FAD-dependent oxidoreductase, partial [Acidimicrobiales bacterium]
MTQIISPEVALANGRPSVRILSDRCAGCQECVVRCPTGALSMDVGRWVAVGDSDLCVGCRQCERTCPFSAVVITGPLLVEPRVEPEPVHPVRLLGDTTEIRSGFATWPEALAEAERCLQCPDPTCVRGCPAHNDIPGFIAALRGRDLQGAHDVLRRTSVLPDICSRVCNQAAQCEGACSWSLAGGAPVAIGQLERFVTDNLVVPPPTVPARREDLSVGIIGSGPAGAGAAWDLIEAGASVTVYERDATPGGLPVWGIPEFTLSDEIARRAWRQLGDAGLDLRCGTEIRPEDLDGLLERHDALIVAHGAGSPIRPPVPGADLDGVVDATTFLQGAKRALEPGGDPRGFRSALGLEPSVKVCPGHVLVLGAGNTAMDVARSARRLGMTVTSIDWLDERWALARPEELAEARHEGVEVQFLRTLVALHGDGRVELAELARTSQDRADRRPRALPGPPVDLAVDLVVMAMGYRNDSSFSSSLPGVPIRKDSLRVPDRRWRGSGILANRASAFANHNPVGPLALGREVALWSSALPVRERTWVVGDALTGPATVVEAMAQGRRAAAAVLDARPARPGRSNEAVSGGPRRVLVCYESVGGTTANAARQIADGYAQHGLMARVLPISKVGAAELAGADAVVIGSWVEGFVVAGVGPAKAMRTWLAELPRIGGKPVSIFCTFAVAPKGTLGAMRRVLEEKGAVVVAQAAFGPKELGPRAGVFGPTAFGERLSRSSPIS